MKGKWVLFSKASQFIYTTEIYHSNSTRVDNRKEKWPHKNHNHFCFRNFKLSLNTDLSWYWNVYPLTLALTKKASLNSKRQGNCLSSWWTESSHCKNTGHCSFWSSAFSWCPHRSPNLWPKSSQSDSTSTWKPWQ